MSSKEIIVYWATTSDEGLRAEEPKNVLKEYVKDKDLNSYAYLRCPAFKDELKNVFSVASIYDIKFDLSEDKQININNTQEFFNSKIGIRDLASSSISIEDYITLFTEEDDLEVSQLPAFMEDNDFLNSTTLIVGKMNIGKWFRPIEPAFHIKRGMSLKYKDIMYYVKFHTESRIKFVRFENKQRIQALAKQCISTREDKGFTAKLSWYYDIFTRNNLKKKVLDEIKANLY